MRHNTYDVKEFYVNDDSGLPIPQKLRIDFPFIAFIESGTLKNQIESLDFLWSAVDTCYAFTMEDDWEFLRTGFIEASIDVLESIGADNILQVWLQPLEENNQHPIKWGFVPSSGLGNYGILSTSGGVWSGTRFNPALKRKADYDLIAPFSQHTSWDPAKPWKSESDISKVYHKLGFKGAILPKQYIKHIGENRHVGA